jgi:16S rRNA (uracil1498-N3)-methyltransferase
VAAGNGIFKRLSSGKFKLIMNLFYTPDLDPEFFSLTEEETRHITKVLRLKEGDHIFLTDGRGNLCEAVILNAQAKKCLVQCGPLKHEYDKRPYHIHIAIAPTKNMDRLEWFLEKATEIGIDEITPIYCAHSERTHLKTERLMKVLIAALKQSIKAYLPVLNEPVSFAKFIANKPEGSKFIAYCETGNEAELQKIYRKGSDVLILIGPEGDFSPSEVEQAIKQEFIPISLGKSRLRTETAGVVACHTINLMNRL